MKFLIPVIGMLVLLGCAESMPTNEIASTSAPSTGSPPPPASPASPPPPPATPAVSSTPLTIGKPAQPLAAPTTQRHIARGRIREPVSGDGLIGLPARALISVEDRLALDAKLPKALQLYKAEHGRGPKTHEEFMAEIIEKNLIQLPELKAGYRYVYDPETELLMYESIQK